MKQDNDEMSAHDNWLHQLFNEWCRAEALTHEVLKEVGDDMTHPRYIEAEFMSSEALQRFLCSPAVSPEEVLLKLKIACWYEDYFSDIIEFSSKYIPPRAILAAMRDLENLAMKQGARWAA